jgi:hypothetical protein
MEELIEIPQEQIELAFVATCIEACARITRTSYQDIYQRMKRVGLIDRYLLPHYDTLHTMSRENLAQDVLECLTNWEEQEKNYSDPIKSPVVQEIILCNQIAGIAMLLSKRLRITPSDALQRFYESQTCADLHNHATGLYLYSNLYLTDEYCMEVQNNNA